MRFNAYYYKTKGIAAVLITAVFVLCSTHPAGAAQMSDYCVTPPYIGSGTAPNLLLMVDNSASMNDLQYIDLGGASHNPTYCYDQTYKNTSTYPGYFKAASYYDYDFANFYFSETASFPADSACANPNTLAKISNTLYVCYNATSRSVSRFLAKGSYLNWLSMSKFDIEKQILTGGKYDTGDQTLVAESRGCVGYRYVKQPLTADYVEGGTNTPLGVTFGIRGPYDPYNPSAPSPGGQTYIDIFIGQYNAVTCQTAINDFADLSVNKNTLINDITDCVTYSGSTSKTCQYNTSITCSTDANCGYSNTAGTCGSVTANGTCDTPSGGVCSLNTAGQCSANNGTCPATTGLNGVCVGGSKAGTACNDNTPCKGNGTCTRYCVGGGKAGAVCGTNNQSNNAACASSTCSAGLPPTTSCTINSDCDLKKCTNAGATLGQICTTNSGCNSAICIAGNVGAGCSLNSDCNMATSACTAPAANIGHLCAVNTDCDLTVIGNGHCLAPLSSGMSSVYAKNMHTCYQVLFKGQSLQPSDIKWAEGCDGYYPTYMTCFGGSHDGLQCTGGADCPSGTCINGPDAVRAGSLIYICSTSYAGACATSKCSGGTQAACMTNSDCPVGTCWTSTTWDDTCVSNAIIAYCGAAEVPNVTDPTENASATAQYANVPAILSDSGIMGQLGDPIVQMPVLIHQTAAPTGLIQTFGNRIRMGAMVFNIYGSPQPECSSTYPPTVGAVPCPKICSTDPTRLCGSKLDCPQPATAQCTTISSYPGTKTCYYAASQTQASPITVCASDTDCGVGQTCMPVNEDGAKIVSYIGYGHCALAPTTACTTDAPCTAPGDFCVSDGVGSHSSGLIAVIDSVKGATWTPFAEGFFDAIGYFAKMSDGRSNTNLRINAGDFNENFNPSQKPCQKNNILLITDGMSTADLNSSVTTFAGLYTSGTPSVNGPQTGTGTCTPPYQGSVNFDNLAWAAKNRKISELSATSSITTVPPKASEYITTYVVLSGPSNSLSGECNSQTLLSNTAFNGGTSLPPAAQTPAQLTASIANALESVAAQAAAGTAASVLASGEGSGANLIQAVFYPKRKFINSATGTDDEILWVGRLTNLWYFVDPQFANSNIREDGGDKILDLFADGSNAAHSDFIAQLFFDPSPNVQATKAHRWQDTTGSGVIGASVGADISFDSLGSLWEAGLELWKRDITTTPRTIYTNISSNSTPTLIPFVATATTSSNLAPYLQAADTAEASKIISWVTGSDVTGYRSRTVKVDLNGDGDTLDTDVGGCHTDTCNETVAKVWKLGDILNSTPKISSWMVLNQYHKVYLDSTYGLQGADADLNSAADTNHFVTTPQYKDRGMVFTGANDGMLHAFKLGTLRLKWTGQGATQKGRLEGTDLGKEIWAFIPKNVLPYLKYTADPNYCHVYSVDLTPFVFDASINRPAACVEANDGDCVKTPESWRTVLVGGMRYGGGCKNMGTACAGGGTDCVKTPVDGIGYSSYFALDITDQNNPKLLWEYSSPYLGFATSGPTIVRINAKTGGIADRTKNGRWFVVIGSGPTGPVNTDVHQFMGRSDQNLRIFVLDLKTGALMKGIDSNPGFDTGVQNAFAGSMLNATFDTDLNYSDDVVYIPYVRKCAATTNICNAGDWTDGGVLRLFTKEDTDPANWAVSTVVDGVGPVTSAVAKLQNNNTHTLWLYFGAGRYYYSQLSAKDDQDGARQIIGLKEPTFIASGSASGFNTALTTEVSFCNHPCDNPTGSPIACDAPVTCGDLTNVTDVTKVPADPTVSSFKGWYINLDPSGSFTYPPALATQFAAERNITDPLAVSTGVVFFTTYKPYSDECLLGGKSALWAFKYDTGGTAGTLLKGKALVQVSTGSIEQVNLSDAFTNAGGRKSASMEGVPPTAQGLSIQTPPQPVKRIIHIKER